MGNELVRRRQARHAQRQLELEAEHKLAEARRAYHDTDIDEAVARVCETLKLIRHLPNSARKRWLKAEADPLTDSIVWLRVVIGR